MRSLSRAALAAVLLTGSVTVLASLQPPAALAATPAARLLTNPGFESGLTSWTPDTTAAATVVGSPVHGGSSALSIVDNSGTGGVSVRGDALAVLPGEELTAGIWVQQKAAGAGGALYLEFRRADGSRTTPVGSVVAASSTAWQKLTVTATVPDDAVTANVLAYSRGADIGTTYWDDATVTALAPPLRKVPNAGFEEQRYAPKPTQWTWESANGSVALVSAAHSGKWAVQIDDDDAAGQASLLSDAVPVTAGETVTAGAWVIASGTGAQLYVEFRNAAGVRTGESHLDVTGSGWQKVQVSGVAPAGATTTSVRLYSTVGGNGTARWDDVTLRSSLDEAYAPALAAGAQVLFAGDQRVESYPGAVHRVHPGTKSGVVLTGVPGTWDANPRMEGTVLAEDGLFRMWHSSSAGVGYVTSNDGLTWSRNGRTTPVIAAPRIHPGGVVRNPAWTAGSTLPRFFMLQAQIGGPHAYLPQQSTDGLTWVNVPGAQTITGFDVVNVTWDFVSGRFIATFKNQNTPPYGPRTAWLTTSTDFKTWTTPRPSFAADLLDDEQITDTGIGITPWSEIYSMPAIRYGDQYLGVPQIFDIIHSAARSGDGNPGTDHGRAHLGLATSRDLVNWSRPDRTDLVTPGAKGTWDHGFQAPGTTFLTVQQPNGQQQTRFYYSSFAGDHTCTVQSECNVLGGATSIGLVTWPADRLASFHAAATATVTTRPLTPAGNRLSVNAAPGATGSVRVEVLDADGNTLPGYAASDSTAITTDALAPGATVTWAGKNLPAGPLRLRFQVTGGADLYAFTVN